MPAASCDHPIGTPVRRTPLKIGTATTSEAGVWPRLHEVLLAELRKDGLLEMDDAANDGSHVRALKGGLTPDLRRSTGPAPAANTTSSSTGTAFRSPPL